MSKIEFNYDINDYIKKKNNIINNKKDNVDFYYNNINLGAGRGFGNLNISNSIRNINSSRNDYREFKLEKEKEIMFGHVFQYLDKNVQDPNNLIMPIPRGGESTRKNIELNNLLNNYNYNYKSKIEFKY
jgi:hypothetical protein